MFAVVMAGGSGTRFWPKSRRKKPKQLMKLFGKNTMIQETVSRVSPLTSWEKVFVVTNELQVEELSKQLPQLPSNNILVEPAAKNTAPCIGLAALYLQRKDPDAIMVVLPADHIVRKKSNFLNILKTAQKFLKEEENALITLGIPPTLPHTGYGYISAGEAIPYVCEGNSEVKFFKVNKFTEKPDREKAIKFLAEGTYYWNSGAFIWKAKTILKMIQTHLPDLYHALMVFEKNIGTNKNKEKTSLEKLYNDIASVSIDFGIMEKSSETVMIEADIGWSDIGSWAAMEEIHTKDESENICIGEHVVIDSKNCVIFSPRKLVALVGVEDIVVVETEDAALICKKSKTEDVKKVIEILKKKDFKELL